MAKDQADKADKAANDHAFRTQVKLQEKNERERDILITVYTTTERHSMESKGAVPAVLVGRIVRMSKSSGDNTSYPKVELIEPTTENGDVNGFHLQVMEFIASQDDTKIMNVQFKNNSVEGKLVFIYKARRCTAYLLRTTGLLRLGNSTVEYTVYFSDNVVHPGKAFTTCSGIRANDLLTEFDKFG